MSMKMWLVVLALVLGWIVSYVALCTNKPPERDPQTEKLLAYASVYSGRPVPDGEHPTVVYMAPEQMALLMCGSKTAVCPVEGVYFGGKYVFVQTNLEPAHRRSIIVHELTHWLQRRVKAAAPDSCQRSAAAEREAYTVQNHYIHDVEKQTEFFYPPVLVCGR